MYLPQNAEEDIELEGAFEVYDNNNKVLNVSNKKYYKKQESLIYMKTNKLKHK